MLRGDRTKRNCQINYLLNSKLPTRFFGAFGYHIAESEVLRQHKKAVKEKKKNKAKQNYHLRYD